MYYCNICNYQTSILSDIKNHYNSQEHIKNTDTPKDFEEKTNNVLKIKDLECKIKEMKCKIKDLESKNKELAYKNKSLKKSIDNNDEYNDDEYDNDEYDND